MTTAPSRQSPVLMVASAVFGLESLLDQVYAALTGFGYEVWMSHRGTIPLDPRKSNFENCVAAADRCDLFLGIVTGRYGSGIPAEGDTPSIVHQEVRQALKRQKPRWFLVQYEVTIARELLKQFRYDRDGNRRPFAFQRTGVLQDVRVLDMYDEIIQQDVPLSRRTGNWIQPYRSDPEVLEFLRVQFADLDRIRAMVEEVGTGDAANSSETIAMAGETHASEEAG